MRLIQNLLKWLQFIQDSLMLDIFKLERRWLKYKIKKTFPYLLLITISTILIFILPSMLSNKPSSADSTSLKKDSIKLKTISRINPKHDEGIMVLEPSIHFIESMSAASIPISNTEVSTPTISKPTQTSINKNLPNSTISLTTVPAIVKPTQAPIKGTLTSIKRDDAAFDIHELENRFKENSNPNLGVYIARYHYDHGNYSEAYNYALKTNSINSSIDDSWLIFAKSLVKLGKEDQARKTLQLYISNSNSQNAKNYLDTLNKENGK